MSRIRRTAPPGSGGGGEGKEGKEGPRGEVLWRQAWSSATTYAKGDAVSEGGSSYVSLKAANLNHKPSELGEWWGLMAEKGATGATGATGSAGPEGKEGKTGPTGPEGKEGKTGPEGKEGKEGKAPEPGVPGEEQTITNLATNTVPAEPTTVYLSLQYKQEANTPTLTVTVDSKTIYKGILKTLNTIELSIFLDFNVKASGKYVVSAGAGIEKITAVYQPF